MVNTIGLVEHLKSWGLEVEEEPGWRTRGRPGRTFAPRAVLCHHTASGRQSGAQASKSIVTHGRSDLPGPLCHFLLARDGVVRVIAAGYANHGGTGGPKASMPADTANNFSYGIEAENNGVGEPWPAHQLDAYQTLCAALLDWMNITDVSRVIGHKEWTRRKIDPAGIDMAKFRNAVALKLAQHSNAPIVHLHNLKRGTRHPEVLLIKKALDKKKLFHGNLDPYYGSRLVSSYAAWQRHLGYKGADADGVPGETSLRALGFAVLP